MATSINPNLHPAQHGVQLPMFMTARELGEVNSVDYPGNSVAEARDEAEYRHEGRRYRGAPSMAQYMDRIADFLHGNHGVSNPVSVLNYQGVAVPKHLQQTPWGPVKHLSDYLVQGHHRVWSELEHNPDRLIPVEHETMLDPNADMYEIAQSAGRRNRGL